MALTYLVRASFPLSPSLFLVKLNLFVATEWREWTKRTALVVSIGSRANNEIMSVSKLAHLCSLSLVGNLYEITQYLLQQKQKLFQYLNISYRFFFFLLQRKSIHLNIYNYLSIRCKLRINFLAILTAAI